MKKLILFSMICLATVACKKKDSGICYCKYYAGNKTQYDLRSLSRSQQMDSCGVLDKYAQPFAGDCTLE